MDLSTINGKLHQTTTIILVLNVFWMEATSLRTFVKLHGYRVVLCLDFYCLSRMETFTASSAKQGKGRKARDGKVLLIRLLAFNNFPLSGLLNSPSTLLWITCHESYDIFMAEILCRTLRMTTGRIGWRIKGNAGAIKRGFSDFLFSASFSFIKNETFLSFHLHQSRLGIKGSTMLLKARRQSNHFSEKLHFLSFSRLDEFYEDISQLAFYGCFQSDQIDRINNWIFS